MSLLRRLMIVAEGSSEAASNCSRTAIFEEGCMPSRQVSRKYGHRKDGCLMSVRRNNAVHVDMLGNEAAK